MHITEIDKNFKVPKLVERPGLVWKDAEDMPFRIYGIFREGDLFRRLPEKVAAVVNPGVHRLHANASGGRVRFCTDSPYIAIHAELDSVCKVDHFAFTGTIGFDLITGKRHLGTFRPSKDVEHAFEAVVDFAEPGIRTYTIHFPLYSNVRKLYIGLYDGSSLYAAPDYTLESPVVYYGSSITQGGCASRPGNSYPNLLSAFLDCNHINLGFAGNAKGEESIAEYIASLDMSAFVYDYDHNASIATLQNTHMRMFQTIRRAHPRLPILMLSRPKYYISNDEINRQQIIKETYQTARNAGDENVYFISGQDLLVSLARDTGLVDGTHPNDIGFLSMAHVLEPALKQMLHLD